MPVRRTRYVPPSLYLGAKKENGHQSVHSLIAADFLQNKKSQRLCMGRIILWHNYKPKQHVVYPIRIGTIINTALL